VGRADFSASDNGVIGLGNAANLTRLVWFDRSGRQLESLGRDSYYQAMSLSRDRKRLAADSQDPGSANYKVVLFDLARNAPMELTSGNFPVWSPDGSRIAFGSNRNGVYDIFVRSSTGAGQDNSVLASEHNKFLTDWSPDGRWLLYSDQDPKTRIADLMIVSMTGERKPQLIAHSGADNREGRFSPDGRWIAWTDDQSGRQQVYVQSFPAGADRIQISTNGGNHPQWREDGRELFYLAPGGALMAVDMKPATGTTVGIEAGTPKELFQTTIQGFLRGYDVASNGQRFVISDTAMGSTPQPITVLYNWAAGLKH
jgi:Tol biopolymer transport system component